MSESELGGDDAQDGGMKQDFETIVRRLARVNEVVAGLDDAIKAQAFEVLRPFIGTMPPPGESAEHRGPATMQASKHLSQVDTLREFVAQQSGSKPSDNVYTLVAWLYGLYGIEPFKATEIQRLADDAGLTIPARVDMTLDSMQRAGKKLVQKTDRATYRITVHGEIFFREKYHVAKGTVKRPAEG